MPELVHVLDEPKPLVEVSPPEAEIRFQTTVQRFVRATATAEHPLLLFIDDLQWADPVSLSLLQEIVTDPECQYLLVVGAYRSDEVKPEHPLRGLAGAAKGKGVATCALTLTPPDGTALTSMVEDVLDRKVADALLLSGLIEGKTDGSPFFVVQPLEALHAQRLLSRDLETGAWQWRKEAMNRAGIKVDVAVLTSSVDLPPWSTQPSGSDEHRPALVVQLTSSPASMGCSVTRVLPFDDNLLPSKEDRAYSGRVRGSTSLRRDQAPERVCTHSPSRGRMRKAIVSRKKILLVDDSETILMLEQMVLQKGYDLITARDGGSGVAKALEQRPDLILLDIVMPSMNGIEACRRLRAEEATRQTPIVLVTSRGEVSYMEEGFRCGCSDYITKPIDTLELLEKVKSCLGD
jgi:CheY-like chemotaxis protein